ncbi:hypothetical protein JKG47_21930 [Acidithiobacillus sp. MC6.1]|nr:hypothetical protein [Acidithiobacillus sp. MC6.1]
MKYHHGNGTTEWAADKSWNDQPQLFIRSWHVRPRCLDQENQYIIDRRAEAYQTN